MAKLKILFHRKTIGIGDLAMMMRSVEITRLKYPGAIIDIACNYPDLIRGHPVIDGLFNIRTYPLEELQTSYDVIIDQSQPCANYETKYQPHIAKNRIEIFCDNANTTLQNYGYEGIQWDGKCQTLWVNETDRGWAKVLVQNASEGKISIGIFWRCAEEWRNWQGMKILIQLLSLDSRFVLFVFDAENHLPVGSINQFIGYSLNKINALVSCMRLIVSPDTIGIHLAGGLNIPVLAIFGPTDPKIRLESYPNAHWLPIRCSRHPCWYRACRRLSCFRKIKAKQVYKKICELV